MKTKNLGKIVGREMKKQGTKKLFMSKLLKISRPTLNSRLVDGEFTEKQISILKEKGYLPK